jgi:hypothetical protein
MTGPKEGRKRQKVGRGVEEDVVHSLHGDGEVRVERVEDVDVVDDVEYRHICAPNVLIDNHL